MTRQTKNNELGTDRLRIAHKVIEIDPDLRLTRPTPVRDGDTP